MTAWGKLFCRHDWVGHEKYGNVDSWCSLICSKCGEVYDLTWERWT